MVFELTIRIWAKEIQTVGMVFAKEAACVRCFPLVLHPPTCPLIHARMAGKSITCVCSRVWAKVLQMVIEIHFCIGYSTV
jgi:hypothetical protein